jgi:uncharacterized protein (TIGR02594 family)
MGCCEDHKRAEARIKILERELSTRERQIQDVRDCLERQLEQPHSGDLSDTLFFLRGIMPPRDEANLMLVQEAMKYIGITEKGGENKGSEVEEFQKAVDGKASGEPWCAAFMMFCLQQTEDLTGLSSEVFRSEHCMTVWNRSPQHLRKEKPQSGCLVIWQHAGGSSGHMGIVKQVLDDGRMITIEGNTGGSTSGSEIVREGDGVFEKNRSISGSDKMKVAGFLLPF